MTRISRHVLICTMKSFRVGIQMDFTTFLVLHVEKTLVKVFYGPLGNIKVITSRKI